MVVAGAGAGAGAVVGLVEAVAAGAGACESQEKDNPNGQKFSSFLGMDHVSTQWTGLSVILSAAHFTGAKPVTLGATLTHYLGDNRLCSKGDRGRRRSAKIEHGKRRGG